MTNDQSVNFIGHWGLVLGHFGRRPFSLAAVAARLSLHVFAHNRGAIALYEQCGLAMTDNWMALAMDPAR
jgi:hypothetical protein